MDALFNCELKIEFTFQTFEFKCLLFTFSLTFPFLVRLALFFRQIGVINDALFNSALLIQNFSKFRILMSDHAAIPFKKPRFLLVFTMIPLFRPFYTM